MTLAWNKPITINGHKPTVTPQVGMVVQRNETGEWAIIRRIDPVFQGGLLPCFIEGRGYQYHVTEAYTPVLLAPSDLYTAWDALRAVCAHITPLETFGAIPLERGVIEAWRLSGPGVNYLSHGDERIEPEDYPAHMRDLQKYGVLLAWLKQWEAKCDSQ